MKQEYKSVKILQGTHEAFTKLQRRLSAEQDEDFSQDETLDFLMTFFRENNKGGKHKK